MAIAAKVNFVATTLAKYSALVTKDTNTLYFVEDANRIYKGAIDVTESIELVNSFTTAPSADIVAGKLYVNATTLELRIKNGSNWAILSPGYVTAEEDFIDANGSKLATIEATKAYITSQITAITGGTAFVKDIAWEDGALKVDTGEATPASLELTGVSHNVSYDTTNLKLRIPVYGSEDVVVNIPKDNFVRSGRYEANYDLGDGKTGPAIVLVVASSEEATDTSEVVIPAASLIDAYTGTTSNTARVTVSEDNQITASVIIDPKAGNALVQTEAGLAVDISGKADKVSADAAGKILIASVDGNLASGGVSLKTSGEMGESEGQVPTAALIAAAITAAVNAAQQTIVAKLDNITNDSNTGRLDLLEKKVDEIGTSIIGEGTAGEVVISTEAGITRSGAKIGGSVLASTPSATTLATEAAVAEAISWKTLEEA